MFLSLNFKILLFIYFSYLSVKIFFFLLFWCLARLWPSQDLARAKIQLSEKNQNGKKKHNQEPYKRPNNINKIFSDPVLLKKTKASRYVCNVDCKKKILNFIKEIFENLNIKDNY